MRMLSIFSKEIGLSGVVANYVGNTGNAKTTPPHLHYGIYLSDGATNPYFYLID